MKQSEELTLFYIYYLDWLNAGAVDGSVFKRRYGLCTNLHNWVMKHLKLPSRVAYDLGREMDNQFIERRLNVSYPFNQSHYEYEDFRNANLQHINPARIKWVREHAAQAG